ncbi:1-acyl-sn-glycerol-3-phosphate acyltransferase [Oceaniglobus roseus]|uniref:1-acyl-sn-glycerol-3-phosphate acyltransferase n=1 Tax=Oceaniglobus roseus TaxID=1737570 RepID=UPI000C7F08A5|nr:1-acyl-sn-glycerol-3-phosphate acyltransferase [Kandeliimicrobium roseum]
MFRTVELPLWLLILILLFAAFTAASHLLFPSVRWFFRKRAERVVARLNRRLQVPIQPFKLLRRTDTIQRLIYDTRVIEAVSARAKETGVREDVAFDAAKRYAREIVPGFSATAYFSVAIRAARWLANSLFTVCRADPPPEVHRALEHLDPDATVVFVMNHRSNMDYVLVTYLAAERSALSYAVGEWARVWPLSSLIRAMGAYFIRRRSRNALYRRVLARYVQMATAAGVTQAIFPEGGLSLNGAPGAARLGLLSYIIEEHRAGGRDVIFVPVALNYDRVIEDRILVQAAASGERRFRGSFASGAAFVLRWGWRRITGKARRFGLAAVSYGMPLALSGTDPDPEKVGAVLMERLGAAVPVLPIPLACLALKQAAGPQQEAALLARMAALEAAFRAAGARLCLDAPPRSLAPLDMLRLRGMVRDSGGGLGIVPGKEALVEFYAASVAHLLIGATSETTQTSSAQTVGT